MDTTLLRDDSRDFLTGLRNIAGYGYSSPESKMNYNSMLPIAQQLKKASGTRYSARYLVKFYGTPEALQRKLAWVRGCNSSVG